MDRDKMTEWCIAGACSVAIHVFIILLFIWLGKSSSDPAPQPESATAVRETTPEPSPETPHETDEVASTTTPSEPRTRTYTVQPKDTLSGLARKCGSKTQAEIAKMSAKIAQLNDLDKDARLQVGQIIKLPAAD